MRPIVTPERIKMAAIVLGAYVLASVAGGMSKEATIAQERAMLDAIKPTTLAQFSPPTKTTTVRHAPRARVERRRTNAAPAVISIPLHVVATPEPRPTEMGNDYFVRLH